MQKQEDTDIQEEQSQIAEHKFKTKKPLLLIGGKEVPPPFPSRPRKARNSIQRNTSNKRLRNKQPHSMHE